MFDFILCTYYYLPYLILPLHPVDGAEDMGWQRCEYHKQGREELAGSSGESVNSEERGGI
jgi:hypothetical protein